MLRRRTNGDQTPKKKRFDVELTKTYIDVFSVRAETPEEALALVMSGKMTPEDSFWDGNEPSRIVVKDADGFEVC
jgi:hypothetical protein